MTTSEPAPLWVLEAHADEGYAVLRRTPEPFEDLGQLESENSAIVLRMPAAHRTWGLVVDMRDASARNDPGFEAAMRPLRAAVSRKYARVAVLLASAVGVLQVQRIRGSEGDSTFATRSEEEAVRFARGH